MSKQITRVFGPDGLLKREFPGYEPRLSQIELALSVESNARLGGRLIAEAPTGVGKSLGYLVPLIPFAQAGERTMVVTSSIVLQEQIVKKDLPLLSRILPEPFTYALAKGIGNYLCLNEFEDLAGEANMVGVKDPDLAEQWPIVKDWATKTVDGDLSELPFELTPKLRLRVTTNSDDCLGRKCAHHNECFPRQARKRAMTANVVVTNYHLFFADLSVKAGDPDKGPLPAYKHVVFDEAHDAPEIAREFFGFRVSPGAVRRATRFLSGNANLGIEPMDEKSLQSKLRLATDEFFDQVRELSKRRDYKGRLEAERMIDPTRLNVQLQLVSRAYGAAIPSCPPAGQEALTRAMQRCSSIASQLEYAAALHEPTKFVYFIDEPAAVAMKPIDVGPMLEKHLFKDDRVKSIVMTSATLASSKHEGERFSFFQQEIGCYRADELAVDSPFDFASNVLLYLPKPMHDPNQEPFADEVADVCWNVAQAAGGRLLGLFTSFKILRHVRNTFQRRGSPWTLLVQGDAPRSLLIERFKADEQSVLLGCESFWQGVDVPGPALSAVVIDKIPFPHHDDPVMGAIQAIDKNWFTTRALPGAGIALKQGFGRLIRTSTDRGVVTICDPRLRTKGYGKKIIRLLPEGLRTTNHLSDVERFFATV